MKKLLRIVVLSFMFATPLLSQVIDLTKCRWTKSGTQELKWSKNWDSFNRTILKDSKLPFGTYEKYTYSIDLKNGVITLLRVHSDEWLIYQEKNYAENDSSLWSPPRKKYETFKYPILSIVDNIIEGKKIFINIENGEVLKGRDTYTCLTPLKKNNKSNNINSNDKNSTLKTILKMLR